MIWFVTEPRLTLWTLLQLYCLRNNLDFFKRKRIGNSSTSIIQLSRFYVHIEEVIPEVYF